MYIRMYSGTPFTDEKVSFDMHARGTWGGKRCPFTEFRGVLIEGFHCTVYTHSIYQT